MEKVSDWNSYPDKKPDKNKTCVVLFNPDIESDNPKEGAVFWLARFKKDETKEYFVDLYRGFTLKDPDYWVQLPLIPLETCLMVDLIRFFNSPKLKIEGTPEDMIFRLEENEEKNQNNTLPS